MTKEEFEASKKIDVFGMEPQLPITGLFLTIHQQHNIDYQQIVILK
jgi:hypothetical protein